MPKAKKTATTKATLATNRRRRQSRRNPGSVVANPPAGQDFMRVLLPGFGAYAATRVLQRIVYQLVQKRWPKLGKHAHALAGAAAFGGVWFGAHRVKRLEAYHDGIVAGSAIAALHGIAACYLPAKYAWLISDCKPSDAKAPALPASTISELPAGPVAADDFDFLESEMDEVERSGSKRARTILAPQAIGPPDRERADDGRWLGRRRHGP